MGSNSNATYRHKISTTPISKRKNCTSNKYYKIGSVPFISFRSMWKMSIMCWSISKATISGRSRHPSRVRLKQFKFGDAHYAPDRNFNKPKLDAI